ncbi:MAG: Alanine racemase [Candidatus Saccharibacteria bacterium]|nr:Alanine racemase [Candidatus Saccharibacteria bacterium]
MSLRYALGRSLGKLEKPFEVYNHITVSRSALLSNFDILRSLTPIKTIFPVLKANAYGHGLTEVATILKDRSFPYIAVDGFYESMAIHNVSKQPVLVMGAIKPSNFKQMSFKRLAFVVHDNDTVKALGATKRQVNVHVEIDTGMTRHGVAASDLPEFLDLLKKYPKIKVEGVMTHLADAENIKTANFTNSQAERFDAAVEIILSNGFKPKHFHIAQSAGSTKVHSKYANALRIGIALYGVSPLDIKDKNYALFKPLKPALALTSTITKVVKVHAGTTVSYDRTFTAKEDTKIGVLPIGYYEGVSRSLSNVGLVQFKSEYLPIVGRVCMNHTMVDIGKSSAKVGDEVIIISSDRDSKVSADYLRQNFHQFNYGLLTALNPNIRRRIVA